MGSIWILILFVEVAVGLAAHEWPPYLVALTLAATIATVSYFTSAILQVKQAQMVAGTVASDR